MPPPHPLVPFRRRMRFPCAYREGKGVASDDTWGLYIKGVDEETNITPNTIKHAQQSPQKKTVNKEIKTEICKNPLVYSSRSLFYIVVESSFLK